jgi:hypothetical protein
VSKTNIRQHQQALETKQSKFNEANLNERMAETKHENSNCNLPIVRQRALTWWNAMSLEEQFYITIEHNNLITGDHTRHPHTLTGGEIEILHKAHVA